MPATMPATMPPSSTRRRPSPADGWVAAEAVARTVAAVRPDATPDQIEDVYDRLTALIRESGLAA